MQVFPYVPGIKDMQNVHIVGFRLDQVLKFILTTPVQVSTPLYMTLIFALEQSSPSPPLHALSRMTLPAIVF